MGESKARRTLVVGSRAQPLLSLCVGEQGLASVCPALLIHVVGMSLSLCIGYRGVR